MAFYSRSSLVPGDTGFIDVFVNDLVTGNTERVSVASDGSSANADSYNAYWGSLGISDDGRYVAFPSEASNLVLGDTNQVENVFVHDRLTGETERVSVSGQENEANSGKYWTWVAISGNGRFVAFDSDADNLVSRDGNPLSDIFVRDRAAGRTYLLDVNPAGTQGNQGAQDQMALSADGRCAAFTSSSSNLVPGDENSTLDTFRTCWEN